MRARNVAHECHWASFLWLTIISHMLLAFFFSSRIYVHRSCGREEEPWTFNSPNQEVYGIFREMCCLLLFKRLQCKIVKNYNLFLEVWNILNLSQQAKVRVKEEQVIGIPFKILIFFRHLKQTAANGTRLWANVFHSNDSTSQTNIS